MWSTKHEKLYNIFQNTGVLHYSVLGEEIQYQQYPTVVMETPLGGGILLLPWSSCCGPRGGALLVCSAKMSPSSFVGDPVKINIQGQKVIYPQRM